MKITSVTKVKIKHYKPLTAYYITYFKLLLLLIINASRHLKITKILKFTHFSYQKLL